MGCHRGSRQGYRGKFGPGEGRSRRSIPSIPVQVGGTAVRVLVAGCGYVGTLLASLLVQGGHRAWGLRRSAAPLPPGVVPVRGDVTAPGTLADLPSDLDAVVYAVSPAGRSGPDYRRAYVDGPAHLLDRLGGEGRGPNRFVLLSSTGVYGHSGGEWVDEDTPPTPAGPTAEALLEGEARLGDSGAPAVVLRLGGIYGPGRTRLVDRARAGDCPDAGRYSNRIHGGDAAAAALHLLELEDPRPLYLGVDREPAPLRDVVRWIARRMEVADPCRGGTGEARAGDGGTGEEGPRGDGATGRRGSNKRCSSARLVASGFTFRYPTYREGYAAMLAEP